MMGLSRQHARNSLITESKRTACSPQQHDAATAKAAPVQALHLLDGGLPWRGSTRRAHCRKGEVAAVLGCQEAHDLALLAHGQCNGGAVLTLKHRQHLGAYGEE